MGRMYQPTPLTLNCNQNQTIGAINLMSPNSWLLFIK